MLQRALVQNGLMVHSCVGFCILLKHWRWQFQVLPLLHWVQRDIGAVVNPLKRQLSITQSLIVIILLWFMAAITTIPYIKYLGIIEDGTCKDVWPNAKSTQIYTASLFVIQYAIPLSIILICYIRIGLELTKGPVTYNRMLAKARGKEAKKVIKMLVIVTLTFAILTLPSSIMWMWLDFGNADKTFTSFYDLMDVLYILDFLNSATNPVIYTFCNESFSREFRRQLGCLHPPPPSSETESGRCTSFVPMVSPSPTSNDNGKSKCNGDCTTLLWNDCFKQWNLRNI